MRRPAVRRHSRRLPEWLLWRPWVATASRIGARARPESRPGLSLRERRCACWGRTLRVGRRDTMLADDPTAIEARVHQRLDALAVEHEMLECEPEFADTAAFCARYGVPPEQSANTIVVAARKEPGVACACLVLATCRLDVNHAVCDLLGVRKASFASAEQTRDITGMMIGGVTPFGLPEQLPLYIDSRVMQQPSVVIGGGSRSMKIRLAPAGLRTLPGARGGDGLAGAYEAPRA